MKKAATLKVFMEKTLEPDRRPNSINMHMTTARTTEGSSPTIKAKVHNKGITSPPFSHRNKNQIIPICIPDKASTWAIPATE